MPAARDFFPFVVPTISGALYWEGILSSPVFLNKVVDGDYNVVLQLSCGAFCFCIPSKGLE